MATRPRRPRPRPKGLVSRTSSRAYVTAKRKLRRKTGRKGRNNGVSPLVPKQTGPGYSHASAKRIKRAERRQRQKKKNGPTIRPLVQPGSPWKFLVYMHCEQYHWRELEMMHNAVHAHIETGISGDYQVTKKKPRYSSLKFMFINCLKLTDEADLFTLMLCCKDAVRKVFRIVDEETQTGL